MRRTLPLTIVLAAVVVVGCASPAPHRISQPAATSPASGPARSTSTTTTTSTTTSTTSTTTTHRPAADPERAAAAAFAAAYVRFLDGTATAGELPAATASVRAQAAQAGAIPTRRRRGTLVLTKLEPARGLTDAYLLSARDDAHTFYAQLNLTLQARHWIVSQLTPPDFDQVFAAAGPPPPRPPAGSAAAEQAARAFLRGYLPWLYAEGSLKAIADATRGLLSRLAASPPNVPPTMQRLHPRVDAIAMQRDHGSWRALPSITDGHETYEIVLTIKHTSTVWQVSNVGVPR